MKPEDCHHIFAYGSLMWRPDFEFEKSHHATIIGYHRRLSILSHHYRGTFEKPGLVLGLDDGGSCEGVVYDVSLAKWSEVLAYIRKRELVSEAYREVVKTVHLVDRLYSVEAVTYVVNHQHGQFFAPQPIEKTLAMVKQGHGLAGSCVEYVLNTVNHLRGLGIHEAELETLVTHLPVSGSVNP
jgi:glutathione-specific gamma-glutamylcyclotransferase